MHQAQFLWANLHTKYKNNTSLDPFKSKIKAWKYRLSMKAIRGILVKSIYLKELIIDNQGRLNNKNSKIQK